MKAEKSVQYTAKDFANLEVEANKILHGKSELSFNQRFNLYNASIQPIIKWANSKLKFALDANRMTKDDFERWCHNVDSELCRNMDVKDYQKEKELNEKSMLLFENEEFRIIGLLDYDCDAKICKFTVTDKETGFKFRYAYFFRNM